MAKRLWRGARRWLPLAAVAALALTLVITAIAAQGFPVRHLDLNDTGIWISNDADGEYGRINKAVGALDARLTPPGQRAASFSLDILQDGALAVGVDQSNATATLIDTALGKPKSNSEVGIDPDGSLQIGGGTIARMDRAGRVWATRYDPLVGQANLAALDPATKPLAELGLPADAVRGAAALTVAADGAVHLAATNGHRLSIPVEGDGFGKPQPSQVAANAGTLTLTTVGTREVTLEADTGRLQLPGGRQVSVDGKQARLQQPGPDADWVLVATSTALLRVGLDDGLINPVDTGGNGEPSAPVRLGGCDFAAWAGPGRVVRACDNSHLEVQQVDRSGGLIRPVFRVNHSEILLNDQANGRAWDLDNQRSVDNWPDLRPQANQQQQTEKRASPQDAKPHAVDDQVLVRPERTTVLHPLDNDMDTAGGILAITSLGTSALPRGASAQISPDGQTVLFSLPRGASRAQFSYVISNGVATDEGHVSITDAGSRQTAPHLRPRYQPVTYATPSFGVLAIPVANQWRDDEGDPVSVLSASDQDGTAIPVTSDGVITFTAAEEPAEVVRTLRYQVTSGDRSQAAGTVMVRVLAARKSTTTVAAVAEPDIARGQVGKPIAITPLANDRPGADPRDLSARLVLNSEVSGKANLAVTTDTRSGQVLAVAARAGSYFLSYSVAYGNAPVATGRIRVDVAPASESLRPVAMPDQVAVHGQSPVLVDVAANDYDPGGGVLTVQSADPTQPTQVQAQVVAGRWLRILPSATLFPNPQAVHYTITNGTQQSTGDVLLTQFATVEQDAVLARKDTAVVRVADSVLIPVLANDSSLAGQTLSLASDGLDSGHDGELRVIDPSRRADADQGDVGRAFICGSQVRYVAPATVEGTRQVVISYTAQTSSGDTAESQVVVTIKPEPTADDPNQAPSAGNVDVRVVSGSRVKIDIPTSGQDPDGDTVTVSAIGSAPARGRVVALAGQSITYEAYPSDDLVGTDTFSYVVVDRYGATGSGSIRVGVTEPGQTQPPVAIDDVITAAPGAEVQAHVMANDLVSADDQVSVTPLTSLNKPLPHSVVLDSPTGPISASAPGAFDQPTLVNYSLVGNGGTGPSATMKIVSREGFNNPPVVVDQTATVSGQVATAKLLDRAWDLDGPVSALTPQVLTPVAGMTLVGDELKVPVLDRPQVIAFQVSDAGGALSAAVVYVPPGRGGPPRLLNGARIELASNSSRTVALSDYVESPRTPVVRIVGATAGASPVDGLAAQVVDSGHIAVTASHGYGGPGSVTVEVMDSASQTDAGVLRALVTIPVQVGTPTPVLRCPETPQVVVQGGEIKNLDITTLCHVWSADPAELPTLTYSAQWTKAIAGVRVSAEGRRVSLQADGSATGGSQGSVSISLPGTQAKPASIAVIVTAAPPPQLRAQRISDIKAGTPVPISLSVDSPLLDAQVAVLGVTKVSGGDATVTHDATSVTITPGQQTSGELSFRVRATDLGSDPGRKDRWVDGLVTVVVYAVPDAPGRPQAGPSVQSHATTLSWKPSQSHGAAIDSYQVRIASGPGAGRVITCRSTPCQIGGLDNGSPLTFTVQAHNKAGLSQPSPPSSPITPDIAPGAPAWVKISDPQDKSVLVSWGPITNDGSAVKTIHVTVDGVDKTAPGTATSLRVATPSNNVRYTFSVAAENSHDIGQAVFKQGQSSGRPIGLTVAAPQPQSSTGASTAVKLTWSLDSAEGPGPVTYAVVSGGGDTICQGTTATSCIDDKVAFDGTSHTYQVTATNATGGSAHSIKASSPKWNATGIPDDWAAWTLAPTGRDGQISLDYTVPQSRGTRSTVTLLHDGNDFRSMPAATPRGGAVNTTLDGLANGQSYSLSLRVCNEAENCSTSRVNSVRPYGPLSVPDFTTSANGDTVTVNASGDGNGASAKLVVKVGSVQCESGSSSGALSRSCSAQIGWGTAAAVSVQLVDTSTYSRATRERTGSAASDPKPPQPKVLVRMGAQQTRVDQNYNCTSSKCHWVVVELQDFTGTATCRIADSDLFGAWGGSWSQGNGSLTTDKLYGGNWIVVTCNGVSSGRVPWG